MRLLSPKFAPKVIGGRALCLQTPRRNIIWPRFYTANANRTYNDAVDVLNTLQTPHEVLKARWDAGIFIDKTANEVMRKSLARIGYSQSDLSKLNIIHVAGTKGKGSTCAYIDSILSQYRELRTIPLKVGLFTSPHLIAVRERLRINSTPISKELFAKYFFEVWDALGDAEKPVYFRYLALMSYHAFIQEGVDVAIYEVGMGGEYDVTNIVEEPSVTGITSLGIDHTLALGHTIEEIAWHKAGIQKPGCPSFTVLQLPAAMNVIENRAKERNVKVLKVIGEDNRLTDVKIHPNAPFQKLNASLGVALVETVLGKLDPNFQRPSGTLCNEFTKGLEEMVWRGRCEKKVDGRITWYLDGAHTPESIIVATKWFGDECSARSGTRVLIFNQQGHREAMELLEGLHAAIAANKLPKFDHVVFCPVSSQIDTASKRDFVNLMNDATAITSLTMQKSFANKWRTLEASHNTIINVLSGVDSALEYVRRLERENEEPKPEVHALIIGSVHLVGRALGVLDGVDAV